MERITRFDWRIRAISITFAAVIGVSHQALAARFDTQVPMHEKGTATFYVDSYVSGLGDQQMMVDTGSGYLAINELALKEISAQGMAHYVKELRGVLANGVVLQVPVYRIEAIRIGGECWIHDVHAAVFPGKTRFILGLSALSKASPFIFETNPPQLTLSNCGKPKVLTTEAPIAPAPASKDKEPLTAAIEG